MKAVFVLLATLLAAVFAGTEKYGLTDMELLVHQRYRNATATQDKAMLGVSGWVLKALRNAAWTFSAWPPILLQRLTRWSSP